MKLLNEREINKFAFDQCYLKRETKELRDLITLPEVAYCYCKYIKDDQEMKDKIPKDIYNDLKKRDSQIKLLRANDTIYLMGLWYEFDYRDSNFINYISNKIASEVAKDIDKEIMSSLQNK